MIQSTEVPATGRWTSHALEWGIGSILIGVLILAIAPLAAIAAVRKMGKREAAKRLEGLD